MSNTNDSFIDEVTEEVRREKLFGLMKRYGWIAVVVIVVLVGGTAWKQWQDAKIAASAQAVGDSLLDAMAVQDVAARSEALAALDVPGSAAAVQKMFEAAALVEAEDPEQAAAILSEIAGNQAIEPIWRDLATLKRVLLLGRDLTPEQRIAELAPISNPGSPYRVMAREQEALARYDLGEVDAAIEIFDEISNDQEASLDLRLRAVQMKLVLEETRDDA